MGGDAERVHTGLRLMYELCAHAIQISLALWLLQRQIELAFLAPLILLSFGVAISFTLSNVLFHTKLNGCLAYRNEQG